MADPDIAWRISIPQPYTVADAREFIADDKAFWQHGRDAFFAITDFNSGHLLGSISRHGPDDGTASFGYWLAAEARGRGFATRALRLISDWTLTSTGALLLEVKAVTDNLASAAVAERAGYTRVGILPADYNERGVIKDCVLFIRERTADNQI